MHEKDQKIRDLERKMEDKERELHAIRLDNEAVSLTIYYAFLLLTRELHYTFVTLYCVFCWIKPFHLY